MAFRLKLPLLKRARRSAGFSMIELLTVIFLIAFMISFLTYAMLNYMKGARIKASKAQLQRLGLALNAYYSDFHEYPPDSGYGLTIGGGSQGTTVLYDAGTLYRYLAQPLHWLKTSTTGGGTIDKGMYGPYMKFEAWELKKYTDSQYGDSFMIIDPWGTAVGYIGDPKRKIHNRDGVDLYSAGPDKKTASDDPKANLNFPSGYNHDNQAYDGQDNDGDGVVDNATELGYAVLNGALTTFLSKDYKIIGQSDPTKNSSLDDINNWDPEN